VQLLYIPTTALCKLFVSSKKLINLEVVYLLNFPKITRYKIILTVCLLLNYSSKSKRLHIILYKGYFVCAHMFLTYIYISTSENRVFITTIPLITRRNKQLIIHVPLKLDNYVYVYRQRIKMQQ